MSLTERKLIIDEIISDKSIVYEDFELKQYILEIAKNEVVDIYVEGVKVKTFIGKFDNSHINIQFQTLGKMKESPISELSLQDQINELKKEIG